MTRVVYTPGSEVDARVEKIQQLMAPAGLDGVIVIHHTNLFYFSGTSQSAHLFIPVTGQPVLMVKKSYERAQKESPLYRIVPLKSLKKMIPLLRDMGFDHLGRLGFELDIMPYNTVSYYRKVLEGHGILDASGIIRQLRLIKSPYEIELLKRSCLVLDQTFSKVPSMLRPGMREVELAAGFEAELRANGFGGSTRMRAFNQDLLFGNIVSGSSGNAPSYFDGPVGGHGLGPANHPHGAGWKRIETDEAVYIDYTCVVNGYTADAQRVFVMGTLPDDLMKAHDAALEIQEKVTRVIEPGMACHVPYDTALEMARAHGLEAHFMGQGPDASRFVAHGVGLELDESPILASGFDMTLDVGMTFALEPKFVFDHGAVGIENTFAVTERGVEKLNRFNEQIISV